MTDKASRIKQRTSIFFLFIGLVILGTLLYYMDFSVIAKSFNLVGAKIFFVFAVAIIWIICNTLCVSTLVGHRIAFHHLLYNQVTGDGYNVITPFAGLGGEPYKVTHLANWLTLEEASETIMRDRLIHSLSGIIFTCMTLWAVVIFLPLEQSFFYTFTIIGTVLSIFSFIYSYIILSSAPEKLLGTLLKKLNVLKNFRSNPLERTIFLQALFFKILGRIANMLEFVVIFLLLGIDPVLLDIVTISAMLALSGTLLFIIPQGIGVNEAGISGAFKLIGQSVDVGLTVGLIRRARVLFWALLGVGIHLLTLVIKKSYLIKEKE